MSDLEADVQAARIFFKRIGVECANAFYAHNEAVSNAQRTIRFLLAQSPQLTGIGIELAKIANTHNDAAAKALDMVDFVSALASLPGDMPLRARLTPGLFHLQA